MGRAIEKPDEGCAKRAPEIENSDDEGHLEAATENFSRLKTQQEESERSDTAPKDSVPITVNGDEASTPKNPPSRRQSHRRRTDSKNISPRVGIEMGASRTVERSDRSVERKIL